MQEAVMTKTQAENALDALSHDPTSPDYAAHGFVGVPPEQWAWIMKQVSALDVIAGALNNGSQTGPDYLEKLAEIETIKQSLETAFAGIALSGSTPTEAN
jgi:hypothetical protein